MRRSFVIGVGLVAACATSGDETVVVGEQHTLSFHGEQAAFPNLNYDTGKQPAASPVQLQLTFSAAGKLTADAEAVVGGEGEGLTVVGKPGSGRFALDAHIKAAAMLSVNISGLPRYDGPIPGIENLDISIANETMFDPFLIGGTAQLKANLPEIELPPIPLGSLPGKLIITVSSASTVQSDLSGVCAGIETGNKLQFLAQTMTSATIVLKPKIVLTIPIIGEKEYPIPQVTIPVPAISLPLDLGVHDLLDGGEAPTVGAIAARNGCENAGSLTCKAQPVSNFTPTWHPPSALHTNLCSSTQIYAFVSACGTETSTPESCSAFLDSNANERCSKCIITNPESPTYGSFVRTWHGGELNVAGCIAALEPAATSCKSLQAVSQCEAASCAAGCTMANGDDRTACRDDADAGACATQVEATYDCNPTGEGLKCVTADSREEVFHFYADLFCGA